MMLYLGHPKRKHGCKNSTYTLKNYPRYKTCSCKTAEKDIEH